MIHPQPEILATCLEIEGDGRSRSRSGLCLRPYLADLAAAIATAGIPSAICFSATFPWTCGAVHQRIRRRPGAANVRSVAPVILSIPHHSRGNHHFELLDRSRFSNLL